MVPLRHVFGKERVVVSVHLLARRLWVAVVGTFVAQEKIKLVRAKTRSTPNIKLSTYRYAAWVFVLYCKGGLLGSMKPLLCYCNAGGLDVCAVRDCFTLCLPEPLVSASFCVIFCMVYCSADNGHQPSSVSGERSCEREGSGLSVFYCTRTQAIFYIK